MEEGYIQNNDTNIIRLTMKGWQHYENLQKGRTHSKTAFMAMPFDAPEVQRAYEEAFVPAVESTGFLLERVDTRPEAGSIDDLIRVKIRNSKFIVADLTNENRGAYWEAGYAEGLGKKVIYTCAADYFNSRGTHFDTRQFLTITWKSDDLDAARENLQATIRNTFPSEATM